VLSDSLLKTTLHLNNEIQKMNKTILITGASIGKETAKVISIKRLECNRYNRNRKRNRVKQLENVLVAKLDVLELDSIKKRLRWCSKEIWKC
jgi:NADP-dependent 3-hydroxy acid dehydrogenase YdfG